MHRQRAGFTMLEVLVAILLLAVGLIGAAAAQVASARARHATALMSQAVQLAASLAERVRANPANVFEAGSPYLQFQYNAALDGPPPGPAVMCFAGASCSSTQLAAFDLAETAQALYDGFPGGRITLCRDAVPARPSWDCAAASGAPLVIKLGWLRRQADGSLIGSPAVVMPVGGVGP